MENVDFHSLATWMALIGVWVLCFGALYFEWAENARKDIFSRTSDEELTK